MDSFELWESFRVLYEQFTPNTSNPFNLSVHSNSSVHSEHFKRVKHFEQLGLSYKLKEIDFNASQCVGGGTYFEPIEPLELLR